MIENTLHRTLESQSHHLHPLVSWRSILAGLLVSLLALAVFLSLGMAFGGVGLNDGTSAQNAGIFTGIWFVVSAVIALFLGSYFAARISTFHTNRVGSAQGIVIASIFFSLFLWQTLVAVGWAGRTAGNVAGGAALAVGAGASELSSVSNPMIGGIVENALADLNLRAEPSVVFSGVANRLIRGDAEAAKLYLARQSGLTAAEADQKIAQLRAEVDQALLQARDGAAQLLKATGWTLFTMMILGAAAAVGGGALGSRENLRRPLLSEQVERSHELYTAPV